MQNPESYQLPFLVRDMLRFEGAVAFSLRIRTQARRAGTLTIRGITREGMFAFRHTTTANGVAQTQDFRIPDLPTLVSVVDDSSVYIQGEVVATLSLVANGEIIYSLCSGFVHAQKPLSYPESPLEDAVPGRGNFQTIVSADPGAGDEVSITVPSGRMWRVIAANVQLVTSSTAANRRVKLRLQTNGGIDIVTAGAVDQTASTTRNYSWAQRGAIPAESVGTRIMLDMPREVYLITDDTVGTDTENIQAGDNFSVMQLLVEEFFINS